MDGIDLHPKFAGKKIYAMDLTPKALSSIMEFKKQLGIPAGFIEFKQGDSTSLSPPTIEKALLFANPPYAKRLGEEEEVAELYFRMGEHLKKCLQGKSRIDIDRKSRNEKKDSTPNKNGASNCITEISNQDCLNTIFTNSHAKQI